MDERIAARVAIVGSRDFWDYAKLAQRVWAQLAAWDIPITQMTVLSGGCRGTDTLAARWAREHGVPLQVFAANWKAHGRAAGPLRNQQLAAYATHVIAFPCGEGRGTQDMIKRAEARGLPVATFFVDIKLVD